MEYWVLFGYFIFVIVAERMKAICRWVELSFLRIERAEPVNSINRYCFWKQRSAIRYYERNLALNYRADTREIIRADVEAELIFFWTLEVLLFNYDV